MKAMILAAGLGKRLRPITYRLPKALIEIEGKPLIVHHLEKLESMGIGDVVINLRHHGQKIRDYLGGGQSWGVRIEYSEESEPLETGGGIKKALPILGEQPFLCINADIFTDVNFSVLGDALLPPILGRLLLVENPTHNLKGDFKLESTGLLLPENPSPNPSLTFSGISLLSPKLLDDVSRKCFPMVDVFRQAINMG